ncbi:hypothetical protein JRO89_XS10G0124800 [Xanthoceras sorbifolium]|uniref:DUF4218 domain-containing protein n=1 Tax=Xanthoceras sorbifolium TaxID=99658 RepID=A0ABQ8HIE4_9ROSI|nr:hypothetical protein JRO89_XS10G0124800 [Xanthoceras sorbifolium]
MHTLKAYVRNKAHPEGSIAEGYTDHECLSFCSMYFRGIETRFNQPERNYYGDQANQMKHLSIFKPTVRLLGAAIQDELTLSDWAKIREYRVELERDGVRDIEKKQEMEFYRWFSKRELEIEKEDELDLDDPYQQQQSQNIINIVEDIDDDTLCRNDVDMIDVDVNVEVQNDAIDNFMDDDNVTDDVGFNYEGNEEDCISSNDESDCGEDYISSNNESDDT